MKTNNTMYVGRGIAIAALAMFGLTGAAHAASSNYNNETGISGAGHFANLVSGGKSPEFDSSHYDKVNLGSIASTQWIAKAGAQGPMREDEMSATAARQAHELEGRLGPVGGRNTP